MNKSTRAERIELKETLELKVNVEKTAQLQDQTFSAFALNAPRVLGNQTNFLVPAKQMAVFHKALDAPARDLPRLKRLLAKPSVFS